MSLQSRITDLAQAIAADIRTLMRRVPAAADTPTAIATNTFIPSAPAINVLGYPTSPGARHDWVRAAAVPAHGIYQTDMGGQIWVPSPFTIHAEHFGAMVRGQRADAAIQSAVSFAAAAGQGSVVMPAGRYVIQSTIAADLAAARKVSLIGRGADATVLALDGASATRAINLTAPATRTAFAHLADFSVEVMGQVPTGTAIASTMAPGGVQDRISLVAERLRVYGANIATDYIGTFYDFTGQWRPRLTDLFGTGAWGPDVVAPDGLYANTSPLFAADAGLIFDGCYSPYITRCRMSSCKTGFRSIGTAEEAYYLLSCIANQVRTGLHIQRTDPEPLGFVTEFYSSYRDKGIHINGGKLLRIDRPYLDQVDPANKAISAPVDVLLENITDVQVTNGVHNYAGDTRRIAYQVFATVRAQRVAILDYTLSGTYDKGVLIGAGSTSIHVRPGHSNATVTTEIQNGAGSSNLTVERPRPLAARLSRVTTDQSIPNNTWTSVTWNSEAEDTASAWSAAAGENIVVPDGRGVRDARVKARLTFASAGVGLRGVRVRVNGSAPNFGADEFEAAHAGVNIVSCETGKLTVAPGDVITVEAYQTSGNAIGLTAGTSSTWVEVEFS